MSVTSFFTNAFHIKSATAKFSFGASSKSMEVYITEETVCTVLWQQPMLVVVDWQLTTTIWPGWL